jgi:hypothetical protein
MQTVFLGKTHHDDENPPESPGWDNGTPDLTFSSGVFTCVCMWAVYEKCGKSLFLP